MLYQSLAKLGNLLGNPKDKIKTNGKSGIYEINCNHCDTKSIGQTRRSINLRFKEHVAHVKYGRVEKSSLAEHVLNTGHFVEIDNLKLLKPVNNIRKLDAYESLSIFKNQKTILNRDKVQSLIVNCIV